MKKLLFIFAFIFLFTTDINSEIIKNIEISGNVRISDETIILFSEIKKNQDLKNENLNLIIKKLYTTNFFSDINIAFDDGILKISVKENPVVQTLQFKGIKNKRILEVLNDTIQLKEKSSFLKSIAKSDEKIITNILRSNGYYFAEVNSKIISNPNNTVDLIYDVVLGERALITKIKFIGDKKIKDRKFVSKSIFLMLIFSMIVFSTIIITNPYYYVDPIGQLEIQYQTLQDLESYFAASHPPWSPLQKFYMPFLGTFSVTIYPVIDAYYYVFDAENIPQSVVNGYAFVSVPLTILFFVGAWYLLRKIMKKELLFSEFLIVIWFLSFFVIISLGNDSFTQTKYYVPMILPIVLVTAYGFVNCLNNILNKAVQKIFFITTIAAHAVTYLIFWENIYFNPEKIWRLPLDINFQKSISDPIVLLCSVIFLISFFIIITIKAKSRQIFG